MLRSGVRFSSAPPSITKNIQHDYAEGELSSMNENIPDPADFITKGAVLERTIAIGEDRVITFMGADLRVYETPSMIADMEYACRDLLFQNLPFGWDSVGVVVNIRHLAATPIGEKATVKATIEEISGRRVRFQCEVHDSVEIVGDGVHERFIVNIERHRARVVSKKKRMRQRESGN